MIKKSIIMEGPQVTAGAVTDGLSNRQCEKDMRDGEPLKYSNSNRKKYSRVKVSEELLLRLRTSLQDGDSMALGDTEGVHGVYQPTDSPEEGHNEVVQETSVLRNLGLSLEDEGISEVSLSASTECNNEKLTIITDSEKRLLTSTKYEDEKSTINDDSEKRLLTSTKYEDEKSTINDDNDDVCHNVSFESLEWDFEDKKDDNSDKENLSSGDDMPVSSSPSSSSLDSVDDCESSSSPSSSDSGAVGSPDLTIRRDSAQTISHSFSWLEEGIISREPVSQSDRNVSKELGTDCSKELDNECSNELKNECSKDLQNECLKVLQNECSKAIVSEFPKELRTDCSKELENECSKELKNECSKVVENEYSKELKNEFSKDFETPCQSTSPELNSDDYSPTNHQDTVIKEPLDEVNDFIDECFNWVNGDHCDQARLGDIQDGISFMDSDKGFSDIRNHNIDVLGNEDETYNNLIENSIAREILKREIEHENNEKKCFTDRNVEEEFGGAMAIDTHDSCRDINRDCMLPTKYLLSTSPPPPPLAPSVGTGSGGVEDGHSHSKSIETNDSRQDVNGGGDGSDYRKPVGENEAADSVSESEWSEAETCIFRDLNAVSSCGSYDSNPNVCGSQDELKDYNSFDEFGETVNNVCDIRLDEDCDAQFEFDDSISNHSDFIQPIGSTIILSDVYYEHPHEYILPSFGKEMEDSNSQSDFSDVEFDANLENDSLELYRKINYINDADKKKRNKTIPAVCSTCHSPRDKNNTNVNHHTNTCLGCIVENECKNSKSNVSDRSDDYFPNSFENTDHSTFSHSRRKRARKKRARGITNETDKGRSSKDEEEEEEEEEEEGEKGAPFFRNFANEIWFDDDNRRWYRVEEKKSGRKRIGERKGGTAGDASISIHLNNHEGGNKRAMERASDMPSDNEGRRGEHKSPEMDNPDEEILKWQKIKQRLSRRTSSRRMRRVVGHEGVAFCKDIDSNVVEIKNKICSHSESCPSYGSSQPYQSECSCNNSGEVCNIGSYESFNGNFSHCISNNSKISPGRCLQQLCNTMESENHSCQMTEKCRPAEMKDDIKSNLEYCKGEKHHSGNDWENEELSGMAFDFSSEMTENKNRISSYVDIGYNSDFEGDGDDCEEAENSCNSESDDDSTLSEKALDSLRFLPIYNDKINARDGGEDSKSIMKEKFKIVRNKFDFHSHQEADEHSKEDENRERTFFMIGPLNDVNGHPNHPNNKNRTRLDEGQCHSVNHCNLQCSCTPLPHYPHASLSAHPFVDSPQRDPIYRHHYPPIIDDTYASFHSHPIYSAYDVDLPHPMNMYLDVAPTHNGMHHASVYNDRVYNNETFDNAFDRGHWQDQHIASKENSIANTPVYPDDLSLRGIINPFANYDEKEAINPFRDYDNPLGSYYSQAVTQPETDAMTNYIKSDVMNESHPLIDRSTYYDNLETSPSFSHQNSSHPISYGQSSQASRQKKLSPRTFPLGEESDCYGKSRTEGFESKVNGAGLAAPFHEIMAKKKQQQNGISSEVRPIDNICFGESVHHSSSSYIQNKKPYGTLTSTSSPSPSFHKNTARRTEIASVDIISNVNEPSEYHVTGRDSDLVNWPKEGNGCHDEMKDTRIMHDSRKINDDNESVSGDVISLESSRKLQSDAKALRLTHASHNRDGDGEHRDGAVAGANAISSYAIFGHQPCEDLTDRWVTTATASNNCLFERNQNQWSDQHAVDDVEYESSHSPNYNASCTGGFKFNEREFDYYPPISHETWIDYRNPHDTRDTHFKKSISHRPYTLGCNDKPLLECKRNEEKQKIDNSNLSDVIAPVHCSKKLTSCNECTCHEKNAKGQRLLSNEKTAKSPLSFYNDIMSREKFWNAVKVGNTGQMPLQINHKKESDIENESNLQPNQGDMGTISSTSHKWLKAVPASCLSHTLCARYPLYKQIRNALCRSDNVLASSMNRLEAQAPIQTQPKCIKEDINLEYLSSVDNSHWPTSMQTPPKNCKQEDKYEYRKSKSPICMQPKSFRKNESVESNYCHITDDFNHTDLWDERKVIKPDLSILRSLKREPPDGTANPDDPVERKINRGNEGGKGENAIRSNESFQSHMRLSKLKVGDFFSNSSRPRSPSEEVWDPGPVRASTPTGEFQLENIKYENAYEETPSHHSLSGIERASQVAHDRHDHCSLESIDIKLEEDELEDPIAEAKLPLASPNRGETPPTPDHNIETNLPFESRNFQHSPRPPPITKPHKTSKAIIPEAPSQRSTILLAVDSLPSPTDEPAITSEIHQQQQPKSQQQQKQPSLIDVMKLGHYEGYVTLPVMFKPIKDSPQVTDTSANHSSQESQDAEVSPSHMPVPEYPKDAKPDAEPDEACQNTQVRVSLRKYCKRKKDGSKKLIIKFTLCLECAGCKEELVEGQALIALDQQWHIWCFKCAACSTVLHGEYMGKDGLPYCEKDYQAQFGVKCAYCSRFISGKVLQAGDNHHFHPTCARCSKCGDPFGDGEEMYLQGTAIWHPRCGPGPTENGTVLNGSLSNGHHVNGEQKTDRERDLDGLSSTASETQFSRSRTPSLNGSFRSYSPYNSLNRKFSGPYRTCSPGLILREYKSSQSPVDITRIYTYSYLTAEPSQGYLKRPLDPYDRPPPKSPHFHRPPSDCRKLSLPKTNSRLGMRVLVDQMQTETPRPKSPHMNNEEPIALSHFPGGRPSAGISRIERDDFPAPPYPYTDPDVSERRRRWSGSTKAVSIDETDEATELEDDDTLVEDPKLKKEEVELSKIATGIGKVFLQQVKEREKIRAWKATHLDPRNASRSPAADREPGYKLRFGTSLNASPSRTTDHNRPWGPEDDEFDRGSSYRCSTGRSSATIPSYNVVSALRGEPKPGYGLKSSTLPAAGRNGGSAGLIGDYSFSGLGEKTQSTEFSSARSDVSAGSLTDADRSALNAELCASTTYSSGLRGYSSYSPHLRRSLPNMHHMSSEPPKIYPAHLLLVSNYRLPNDVDRCHLERHLSDTDFEMVFHMARMDFYRLPEWRRNDLKRRAKLF